MGADLEKKTELLLDQISGLKSPTSSMGTVSKVSTVEERKIEDHPSPTEFPDQEEDYNWRASKINISGELFIAVILAFIPRNVCPPKFIIFIMLR